MQERNKIVSTHTIPYPSSSVTIAPGINAAIADAIVGGMVKGLECEFPWRVSFLWMRVRGVVRRVRV